jgi:hypothetical protein
MKEWPQFTADRPMPVAHTTAVSTSRRHRYEQPVVAAFENAMASRGRLREEAFWIDGFSGRKFRLFMNNLIGEMSAPRYLEIGLFHGASFCPAIYGNRVAAVGVDNWTEYGGTPDRFHENLAKFKPATADVEILQKDFRTVDYGAMRDMNVLFYDGSHSQQDQYDGVLIPQPAMADEYVLIVDDWNWEQVRVGTLDALRDAGARVDYQIEVRTSFGREHLPLVHGSQSEWHNGCLIAAVAKT